MTDDTAIPSLDAQSRLTALLFTLVLVYLGTQPALAAGAVFYPGP